METRANYILIGLFSLFGVLGALGFFIWLAKIEVDRQYAYYDIVFENVSGLDRAADVRFSGLSVGRVISLNLYKDDPSKVKVRIEIAAETPIKTDTKAQLQSQGVTGVAFVALAGGSPFTNLLRQDVGGPVPVIEAERSVVQALTADAPDLLAEAVNLMRRLEQLANDENQANFARILANLEETSTQLVPLTQRADTTMAAASDTLAAIDTSLVKLDGVVESAGGALDTSLANLDSVVVSAKAALETAQGSFERANRILDEDAGAAIADVRAAATQFETAMRLIADDIPAMSADLRSGLDTATTAINRINATVAASAPPFRTFAEEGLPQYTRLARESRVAVEAFKKLIVRMERDPARFFLGNKVPELRR